MSPAPSFYTTIGELYDFIFESCRKTGTEISVPDALRKMRAAGLLSAAPSPVPTFQPSDGREEFRGFLRAMPVPAGRLINSGNGVFPAAEHDIFPLGKDVFAYQHMPYSGLHLHHHDYFEITYIVQGSCPFFFEGERIVLQEGNICIISNRARHEAAPAKGCLAVAILVRKSTFDHLFGGLLSRGDLVSMFFRKCLQDQGLQNYILLRTGSDDVLFRTMRELVSECYKTDDYANDCCISLLNLFLARAIRSSTDDVLLRDYPSYARQDLDFSMILQYIQRNYVTVSLASLADAFHFSEAYLSKLIRKNMNQSFTEVLRTLKMRHALELLHSGMKISEISEAVGYGSVDHFTRTFRKVYGVTPTEYRWQKERNTAETDKSGGNGHESG